MVTCKHCQLDKVPAKDPLKPGFQARVCIDCKRAQNNRRRQKWYAQGHPSWPTQRYHQLTRGAAKRGLVCELTKDRWAELASQPCHYCGGVFDTDKGHGHHLDRIDNDQGYTLSNAISCCGFCNGIKSNRLNHKQTEIAIRAIIAYETDITDRNLYYRRLT